MKQINTAPLFARYEYHEAAAAAGISPLYDRKHEAYVHPARTVRYGKLFLKPKQIVYVLHLPEAKPTEENPDPVIKLPRYTLCLDHNEDNIRAENIQGAFESRRWPESSRRNRVKGVLTADGAFVPADMLATMTKDDIERLDVQLDKPAVRRVPLRKKAQAVPDDWFEDMLDEHFGYDTEPAPQPQAKPAPQPPADPQAMLDIIDNWDE